MKLIGRIMIALSVAGFAFAGGAVAPEIDGSTAASALALVSGGALILRSRKK